MYRWIVLVIAVAGCGTPPKTAHTEKALASAAGPSAKERRYYEDGQLRRICGTVLAKGTSPQNAAEVFIAQRGDGFGPGARDLVCGRALDGVQTTPLMLDPLAGKYRLTLVHHRQARDGVPVYRAGLRSLVRNGTNELVWVGVRLRDLGQFRWPLRAGAKFPADRAWERIVALMPELAGATLASPTAVIWAGAQRPEAPRAAFTLEVHTEYLKTGATPQAWQFVLDAATGEVLHREDLVNYLSGSEVTGTVFGLVTPPPAAAQCDGTAQQALPYAAVRVQGAPRWTYADGDGHFALGCAAAESLTVESRLDGKYFTVITAAGDTETVKSTDVACPGIIELVHNRDPDLEAQRAQVNAYLYANEARAWALQMCDAFPGIGDQTAETGRAFPLVVMVTQNACPGNAWQVSSSFGGAYFCAEGSGVANTAFSCVVYHEYAHNLVHYGAGLLDQGQYGEGAADSVALLILGGDPMGGRGWYVDDCTRGKRQANTVPPNPPATLANCGGDDHLCGRVLSGAIWDTLTALRDSGVEQPAELLSRLLVNSILLYDGDGRITPLIALDFLTLDGESGGTSHADQIHQGFGAHEIDWSPAAEGLRVVPATDAEFEVPRQAGEAREATYKVENVGSSNGLTYTVTVPNEPWITVRVRNGVAGHAVTGTLDAGQSADVIIRVVAPSAEVHTYRGSAAFTNSLGTGGNTTREVRLHVGQREERYSWDLETNPEWTTEGQWAFGRPNPPVPWPESGGSDPPSGHTGLNVYGYNLNGAYEPDIHSPGLSLTTKSIDCSHLVRVRLKFWRWLGVGAGVYDHASLSVSNDHVNWTCLWSNNDLLPCVSMVSRTTAVDDRAWIPQEFDISQYADGCAEVRIRWTMGSTDNTVNYCGWNIDDIEIWGVRTDTSGECAKDTGTNATTGSAGPGAAQPPSARPAKPSTTQPAKAQAAPLATPPATQPSQKPAQGGP